MSTTNPPADDTPGTPAAQATPDTTPPTGAPERELLQFPVDNFPIKVVGVNEDGFVHAITHLAKQFDPSFDASTIELRESGGGKYLGVTIAVRATSREQLDELYRALSTHPMARWVL